MRESECELRDRPAGKLPKELTLSMMVAAGKEAQACLEDESLMKQANRAGELASRVVLAALRVSHCESVRPGSEAT